jgi:hypothetical protein
MSLMILYFVIINHIDLYPWNNDDFSNRHEGWIVTLEVVGSGLGDQEEATRLPLVGISADVKDRENRLETMVGGRPDAHVTHIINTPTRVWLTQPEEIVEKASAATKSLVASAQSSLGGLSFTTEGPYGGVLSLPVGVLVERRARMPGDCPT